VSRHLALVGPTAAGKTALAVEIARTAGDVEIVSLDAMQVYRGMDIGTATPSADVRAEIPHHLVDVADPSEDWSVVRTQQAARAAVAGIEARGRRALLVGGTGLYVAAVVDDLEIPPRDLVVRAALEAQTAGPLALAHAYERLRALDPVAAARIEPGNRRRIVRALEVIEVTGRPFSSFGPGVLGARPPALDVSLIGLRLERDELATRIARRVDEMRRARFLDEVRALAARPAGLSRTAAQAIGYAELLAYLDGTTPVLDDAFAAVAARTRKFARRQRVWFRRDARITWYDASEKNRELAAHILATWAGSVPAVR
jgi:tRNA dimethylallyltransferase